MPVLTLAGSKGGPGKTTLAAGLAAWLARDGVSVLAIDADPTEALGEWLERTYEGPPVACQRVAEDAALAHAITAGTRRFAVVIVDTAGSANRSAGVAMTAADAVLIPTLPSAADVREATRTLRMAEAFALSARRPIAARLVLNRRKPTLLERHTLGQLDGLPRLRAGLSDRVAFGEMTFSGTLPGGPAGVELAYLVAELRELDWIPSRVPASAGGQCHG